MGWWTQGDSEVVIGDEPLDLASEFVQAVAARYEESELGRKPTPAELAATLEMALAATVAQALEGGERLEVSQVSIKTKRRPKRHKVQAGDIFAVPLEDGSYAFGRVMTVVPKKGCVVEYFRATSDHPSWRPTYADSGRVMPPRGISSYVLSEREWQVVAHEDGYEPNDQDKAMEFVGGMPPHMWAENIYFETLRDRIDVDVGKGMPRLSTGSALGEAKLIYQRLHS